MTLIEHAKAQELFIEFHKPEPDWKLVRKLICELASYTLRPLPTGKTITLFELLKKHDWR